MYTRSRDLPRAAATQREKTRDRDEETPLPSQQKVVLALLAGSAAAFQAPAAAPAATAMASASVDETRIGVQAPAGFWDPLGLSTTQPEGFERRRAVERKHGRIAMVAITGCVLHNADVEFPGYLSLSQQLKFPDIPNGGQGIFNIPAAGVAQILLFCGLVEMAWWPASKYDGDYNVGFFGEKLSPEKKTQKLNAEMANGRLAMLGIFGNMVAEAQTGQTLEQMGAGNMIPFYCVLAGLIVGCAARAKRQLDLAELEVVRYSVRVVALGCRGGGVRETRRRRGREPRVHAVAASSPRQNRRPCDHQPTGSPSRPAQGPSPAVAAVTPAYATGPWKTDFAGRRNPGRDGGHRARYTGTDQGAPSAAARTRAARSAPRAAPASAARTRR